MTTAALIIDVQNDFCPGGALAVPAGDEVVRACNRLLASHPLSVLTQDWHPAGHSSFASTHDRPPYTTVALSYGEQVLWPDHCVQGTEGAELHADLATDRARLVLRKGTNPAIDSYSAFFENDRTTRTGLAGWLRDLGVEHLVLGGLALDFCVLYTALDARALGFTVEICAEAVRGIDLDGSVARARAGLAAADVRIR